MGATSGARRVRRAAAVIGVAVLAIVCVSCTKDLGNLGASYGSATDINDSGVVVGYSSIATGEIHAFVKTPSGKMTDLGAGSLGRTTAHAINDHGVVVGSTALRVSGLPWQQPFVWTQDAGYVEFKLPDGETSGWAADVNDAGDVVVNTGRFGGSYKVWIYHLTTGAYTPLPSLSAGYDSAAAIGSDGTVVGSAKVGDGIAHAVKWDPTTHAATDLDAGKAESSAATAINHAGTIVGYNGGIEGGLAYEWKGATRTTIGAGYAKGINDDGVVVGTVRKATGEEVGHLWDVPHSLDFDLAGLASGPSLDATAINDHGVAVGSAGPFTSSSPVQFDAYQVN